MFKENSKAIYLQIADRICDEVLSGSLSPDDRLPSVREYAANVQVNPNTMMRAYEHLSQREVIYNRRGIGFFVCPGAVDTVKEMRRSDLLGDNIHDIFRQLSLLGVSPDTLRDRYAEYLKTHKS